MLNGFPVIEIVSLARACLTRDESFGCASNRKHPGFRHTEVVLELFRLILQFHSSVVRPMFL